MGNMIQYDCERSEPCTYYEAVHNLNGRSIYDEKFKNKCCNCTRPILDKMGGKGIYHQAPGGFKIEGE